MVKKAFEVSLTKNPAITMEAVPGHYTTNAIHVNYYLNVSGLKSNALVAREVAREMSLPYSTSDRVDTIVCMDKTEVIGAYLAEELARSGVSASSDGDIHVVSPASNVNSNLVFTDNAVEWITDRNIVLLVACVSTGRTLKTALACLAYYGGKVAGISALFMSSPETLDHEVHALFTADDIPDYESASPGQCKMCRAGRKLDAIVSNEGYMKI